MDDDKTADELIPGRLKRSPSYHRDYGRKTYREIKRLAAMKPADIKARQMRKLIEQRGRIQEKGRRPGS